MDPIGSAAGPARRRPSSDAARHPGRAGLLLAGLVASALAHGQPMPASAAPAGGSTLASTVTDNAVARPRRANVIAVPDITIRREHRDFFYDERYSASTSMQASRRASADAATMGTSESSTDARSEVSYSRRMGMVRTVSYAELRGLLADVRATLLAAGYEVVQARPATAPADPTKPRPSLRERIAAGDFGDAAWVLGVEIVDTSVRPVRERIDGTSDYSNRLEVGLTAEFALIDTASLAVAMSFNAHGDGADMHLGKATAPFVPDQARIVRELLASFAEDARRKILRNLPRPAVAGEGASRPSDAAASAGGAVARGTGDPATLKVYRDPDAAGDGARPGTGTPAVRVYRD